MPANTLLWTLAARTWLPMAIHPSLVVVAVVLEFNAIFQHTIGYTLQPVLFGGGRIQEHKNESCPWAPNTLATPLHQCIDS